MLKQIYVGVVLLGFVGMAAHGNTLGEKNKEPSNRIQGRVFHDVNNNGRLDVGEKGIARVAVSNGRDIVLSVETLHKESVCRPGADVWRGSRRDSTIPRRGFGQNRLSQSRI